MNMAPEADLRSTADRIDTLVREIGAGGDPAVRAKAEELLEHVLRFYGAGLVRMLEIIDEAPEDESERVFARFSDDDTVATMLLLHDLHPVDLDTRVQKALEGVRPFLKSHGAGVSVLSINDGVVHLKLEAGSDVSPTAANKMKVAIDKAILEAAPDVTRLQLDGVKEAEPALIQLKSAVNRGAVAALSV